MSTLGGQAVEFIAPGRVEIVKSERPDPTEDEVVVKTSVSAISSGTELLVYRGEVPINAPADASLPSIDGTFSYPIRYGYAAVGEVVDVGSEVDRDWIGTTVFGFNPHESYFVSRPDDLLAIPEGISTERAVFLAKVETAVNFVLDANPRIGEDVAVFGQGVIGLLTTALLTRRDLGQVVAIEPVGTRRALAAEMGADTTIDPNEENVVEALQRQGGVDIAIEVSGQPSTLETAVGATCYGGRVIVGSWYGTKREEIGLGIHFHRERISIESSQVSTVDPALRGRWDRERRRHLALSLLESLEVESLITHRLPIESAARAYQVLLDQPDEAIQVLLAYE